MSDEDLDDQRLAFAAAEAGAAVVRAKFGAAMNRIDKGGGDFATEADVEAERVILDLLRRARPGDAVLGEEGGYSGGSSAGRTWLVDPLCGTLNYATGAMLVGVNVALRVGTSVTAAAVADPFADEVFWVSGNRAAVRPSASRGREEGGRGTGGGEELLRPSAVPALVDINLDPPWEGPPGHPGARLISRPEFLGRFRPRVLSTTLALAWVAAGRRAAYVTGGDLGEDNVHFTAGIALCRAAGCVVTDLTGRAVGTAGNGLLAAADAGTHAALLQLLADHDG